VNNKNGKVCIVIDESSTLREKKCVKLIQQLNQIIFVCLQDIECLKQHDVAL
jgi:hypothetical protein